MAKRKLGDCAQVAADLVLLGPLSGFLVCHGKPVGRGPENNDERYFHAWVEDKDGAVVIDRSNGLDVTIARDRYYEIGQIVAENVRRYTSEEVRTFVLDTHEYGPWEELQ